jgi:chemotaxis protein MotC
LLLLTGALAAHAAEGTREPFEVVRTLRVLQDDIANGSSDAHRAQRQVMMSISDDLAAVEPRLWSDPRNVRAAILYVLSGGDPRILRSLLGQGGHPADIGTLMRGALAYAEGRNDEAAQHLSGMEARALDPGLAGTIALVQAALAAPSEPMKAMMLLDEARLLSPGTLVEEVALRRQILLLPEAGQLDRLEPLLARYIRRFGKSFYASAFWRQLAAEIAALELANRQDWQARLAATLDDLDTESRQHIYLSIAQEGIARGRVGLTRFATGHAMGITGPGSPQDLRARVYEAAALIVTAEYERGLSSLTRMKRERLSASDAGLVDAALEVADQIRRPPPPSASIVSAEPTIGVSAERVRELSGIGLVMIGRAQTIMASMDALLSGGAR